MMITIKKEPRLCNRTIQKYPTEYGNDAVLLNCQEKLRNHRSNFLQRIHSNNHQKTVTPIIVSFIELNQKVN